MLGEIEIDNLRGVMHVSASCYDNGKERSTLNLSSLAMA